MTYYVPITHTFSDGSPDKITVSDIDTPETTHVCFCGDIETAKRIARALNVLDAIDAANRQ